MKKLCILCAILFTVGACSTTQEKTMKDDATAATSDAKTAMDKKVDDAKAEASATTATASKALKASCLLDKDTRIIEVKKTDGGGCELFYTKFGDAKSVASSGFGTQYCEEVKDRIQTNLNKAGFACQ